MLPLGMIPVVDDKQEATVKLLTDQSASYHPVRTF
jgi:hypothetical protein